MIKKIKEVKIPQGKKISEMSDEQLDYLRKKAGYRLNEISFGKGKKEHPSEKRVGEGPQPTGLDKAMSMVSDAHRTNELLHERDEEFIKQYPKAAYYYATRVMRDRWREAEPALREDPQIWKQYKLFVKGLPKEKQQYNISESKKNRIVLKEATNVKGKLIAELEPILKVLGEIKTKLSQEHVERRMKALGGEKRQEYVELLEAVDDTIAKLEKIVVEFQEEGYREGL